MAWAHASGIANSIAAWFAVFEAWITGTVGWTVAGGSGTTDLVIQSVGELGGLTMLFARIHHAAPGFPTRIVADVRDDAAGTHATQEAWWLETGGVPFLYWMTADMDTVVIIFKAEGGYRFIYVGLIEPFALTVPDETYRMISTSTVVNARILRRHDGLWNQTDSLFQHFLMDDSRVCQYDGTQVICPTYFGDHQDIAGQLRHITSKMPGALSVNPGDVLVSDWSDAEWTFFREGGTPAGSLFALHSAGTLSAGEADGAHFAHTTGNTISPTGFLDTTLTNFLQGIGWTVTNITSGYSRDKLCYSQGESGNEDIFVRVIYDTAPVPNHYGISVRDDAVGTHETGILWANENIFPGNADYFITGDRDCFVFTMDDGGAYNYFWGGIVVPFNRNLPDSTYKMICCARSAAYLLHGHDGSWSVPHYGIGADWVPAQVSQPNNYDGTTYFVWPFIFTHDLATQPVWQHENIGRLKYLFYSNGGAVVPEDTITWGTQRFAYFVDFWAATWAMRTDLLGAGVNFPGNRLYPLQRFLAQGSDSGLITKNSMSGIVRGDPATPFNPSLRGLGIRYDPPR